MIGSLRNLFSSPKESTTKNPKSGVVKEKTDGIFMVSTIKTATIHKESQSQQKKRPQDPDLNKLMGLPKIEPILKESLEYSVLASRFTVPKHLDFGNVKSLPVEFCKLITIYIHKLVERQTRLRKQLRALKKKNQNCCNGYLQLSQNYERNKKSGIKHLEKLREELGQFKILFNQAIETTKKINTMTESPRTKFANKKLENEKGKEKKKKREMKKENEHENENENENDKGSENENEKETEKETEKEETIEKKELSDSLKKMISANEEEKKELGQVWKTFVERRNKIQMKNYSKAILENAIASAIDKSEKKWVKKQMKKEERRKKRELRKQKNLQGQTSKTKTKTKTKTKSQIVTKTKIKAKTTANTQTKKENKPKPKTEPKNNKTKIKNKKAKQNEKQPQKEKNSKRKKKDTNNEKNRKKEMSTRKKTKQKSTKTGATEKKTENEEIITEEEKLRRENEYLKQQLEMLKNVQQIKTKDN
ncbi:hypothetical protein M0812_07299 [Anaeramoeba flamelloides]|uniref:Uncharacterized protein n=1 Tax=Anaeramoeba flamelloides TaxID=1746091 RepID=A0AAV8A2M7_9EUKA|nr:hypothetical protein M0812_07299 [Anaeramoeba flamelloides]